MGKTLMIIILPITLDGVVILTPSPCGCGLWLFLWVGNVALVLTIPHNDRCGVMIIISGFNGVGLRYPPIIAWWNMVL